VKDIRIAGGANTIQQFLNAGLIDEFTLHYTPIFFGNGIPPFTGVRSDIRARIMETVESKDVTHVTYNVEK